MRKLILIPSLLTLAVGLTACYDRNPNVEKARTDYLALAANQQATDLAPKETQKARELTEQAWKAYREHARVKVVNHEAYLANQAIEVANQTIALQNHQAELTRIAANRADFTYLNANQTDRGWLVTFADVLFATGRAEMDPAADNYIRKLAAFMQENPERNILVEGYTDNTGGRAANVRLAERRAEAVAKRLVILGIDAGRIRTQGYGAAFPVKNNNTVLNRQANRRVEVVISNGSELVQPRR